MDEVAGASTFRAPAHAYDRLVGRYSAKLADALIAAVGVRPGQRAVDVGCGPGGLTSALAAVLGADHVAGVDPSEPFAAACAERVPGARVEVGAAEALPFDDDEFDVALSQLVVNFMSDAHAGVREMRRVTKPGGTVASAVWDYREGMTLLRRFWDAAIAIDPEAVGRDEGRNMPYCTPDELEGLWREAGLEEPAVSTLTVGAGYESFDDLWEPLEGGPGPAGAYAGGLPDDQRARLRDELRRRLDVGDGPFSLDARAWCVVGRVP